MSDSPRLRGKKIFDLNAQTLELESHKELLLSAYRLVNNCDWTIEQVIQEIQELAQDTYDSDSQ